MAHGIFITGPAQPTTTAPVVVGLQHVWTGWDSSEWGFDAGSGVIMKATPVGMQIPENLVFYSSDSPAVDGQQDRGWRLPARDVVWSLHFLGDAGQPWLDVKSAFGRTLQPGRYGTWQVTAPGGTVRTLRCRLNQGNDPSFDKAPSLVGWGAYGVRLLAPDPYWRGIPITWSWTQASGGDFFNGVSKAPPFSIATSSSIAAATITNPGDVDCWPVWTVYGPTTSVDVGLNGRLIQLHFSITSGQAVVVDASPGQQTAIRYTVTGGAIDYTTGVEVTGSLGTADFAPIPAASTSALSLGMTGTGSVSAVLTPGYFEAY